MGTASRPAGRRRRAALAAVLLVLVGAALACGLAALVAGPAQAAPGDIIWKKTFDPTRSLDTFDLCARGPSGSLYAVGMRGSNKGDIWISRYKSNGVLMWSKWWDDVRHSTDRPRAIAVDGAGNVFIAGYAEGTPTVTDSVVLKYSPAGKRMWSTVHAFGGYEEASAIGLDSAGNAYVAGQEQPTDGHGLLYVARFAAGNGDVAWSWTQDAPDTNSSGLAIAVTSTGTCYAAGTIAAFGASAASGYLVKVTDGARDWEQRWDGPNGNTTWLRYAALAPGGDVVVAGETGMGGPSDLLVGRYSSEGIRTWDGTHNVDGTYTSEMAEDLAVAADGSIWVCASSDDYVSDTVDIRRGVLVRWSPVGEKTAATIGSAKSAAMLSSVVTDPTGNAYVAGAIARGSAVDGVVARFTPAGTRSWIRYVSLSTRTADYANDVAIGPSGSIYAVGTLEAEGRNSRAVALRLRK